MSHSSRMGIGKRILEVLGETRRKQVWLCEAAGIEPGTLSALITRDSVRSVFAPQIADALNVHERWLTTGEGPKYKNIPAMQPLGHYNVTPATTPALFPWPMVSWISAGRRSDAVEPYENGGAPTVKFESEPGAEDYALVVRGDSMMRPDGTGFPDGCHIAVKKHRKPKNKDFVIARFTHTDEATFKQFVIDGGIKLLVPLNPAYPKQMFPPDAIIVGTVCEMLSVQKF